MATPSNHVAFTGLSQAEHRYSVTLQLRSANHNIKVAALQKSM